MDSGLAQVLVKTCGSGGGQLNEEARSASRSVALRVRATVHGIGQGADDREPDTGTTEGATAGRIDAVEPLEDDLELVLREPRAFVGDDDDGLGAVETGRDGDRCAGWRVADGVRQV